MGVHWRLCCSTTTLTISPYTQKHTVSFMQMTCALHLKEKTATTSRQHSHQHWTPSHPTTNLTNCVPINLRRRYACAFHLRNSDAKRQLNVFWNETRLINTATPVYLVIHLDRTLSHKVNLKKTKMKVNAQNNTIRKLANLKWGCRASTLRTSCLALCNSAAEYACRVWERSRHANKLNSALHECCRSTTGYINLSNVTSIHLLAGIAPPHIRRAVAGRAKRQRQTTQTSHQLYDHVPSAGRLKSRNSFMRTVTPLNSSPNYTRLQMWNNQLTHAPANIKLVLQAAEDLPAGSDQPWLCCRSLNRLRTGIDRVKTTMRRRGYIDNTRVYIDNTRGYIDNTQSVNCDCGEPQTMAHLICCRLLDEPCSPEDLTIITERAKACARMCQHLVRRTREKWTLQTAIRV